VHGVFFFTDRPFGEPPLSGVDPKEKMQTLHFWVCIISIGNLERQAKFAGITNLKPG